MASLASTPHSATVYQPCKPTVCLSGLANRRLQPERYLCAVASLILIFALTFTLAGYGGGGGDRNISSGGNVYVSGYYLKSDYYEMPCYWKDGTRMDLPISGSGGFASGITVNNGNVYVSGYYVDNNDAVKACYWKDGVRTDLSGNIDDDVFCRIAVSDGKVYVSGISTDSNHNEKACYWVNGTRVELGGGEQGAATGIAVVTR